MQPAKHNLTLKTPKKRIRIKHVSQKKMNGPTWTRKKYTPNPKNPSLPNVGCRFKSTKDVWIVFSRTKCRGFATTRALIIICHPPSLPFLRAILLLTKTSILANTSLKVCYCPLIFTRFQVKMNSKGPKRNWMPLQKPKSCPISKNHRRRRNIFPSRLYKRNKPLNIPCRVILMPLGIRLPPIMNVLLIRRTLSQSRVPDRQHG